MARVTRIVFLAIDIGLAPVYPAEFAIIRITPKTESPDSVA
ncbi:hypothetical protein [Dyella psychrodurans]|nr:hypothetical protein [Dyella psychrodurans]